MPDLVRMTCSIERPLYEKMELMIRESHYTNRSEFVRDMVRDQAVAREWAGDQEALGTITLIYDHHLRQLTEKLTKVQHHHHKEILASTHVHLDEDICAEVIIARGHASAIRHIADELRKQRGVLHATLSMSTTGKNMA